MVRILDGPELGNEELTQVLREINDRQWAAYRQVLIEAKFKAEAMLRNDAIFDSHGKVTYYQGWVAYADYVISSFEALRERSSEPEPELHAGPPE